MGSSRVGSSAAATRVMTDDDMDHSVPASDPLPATIAAAPRKTSLSTDVVHRGVHNLCVAHREVWTTVWETRG